MLKNFLSSAVILLAACGQSCWAELILYSTTGAPGDQSFTAPSTSAANGSAGNLVRGSGLTANSGSGSINSRDWTQSATPDSADYYGFSFTANAGFRATYTTLSFAETRSSTGIRAFEVRSSLDGFGTFASQGVFINPDDVLTRQRSVSLSGLTNLTGTVDFRIYGYSAEGTVGTWRLQNNLANNGIVLDGTITAVPEPTSLTLLSVAGFVGLVTAHRRRKSKKIMTVYFDCNVSPSDLSRSLHE